MNASKQLLFRCLAGSLRLYERLFLDLRVWGAGRLPPGPKIFVTNHITTTDPYWVLPFFGEPVHIIIGPGYQSKLMGRVYDWFEQINALPAHRKTVVDKAVGYLDRGESVYTAPEGDLQDPEVLGPFFPGVGRIYRRTLAPIIPIALYAPRRAMKDYPGLSMMVDGRVYRTVVVWRGPFVINIGDPLCLPIRRDLDEETDARRITDALRTRIAELAHEIRGVASPSLASSPPHPPTPHPLISYSPASFSARVAPPSCRPGRPA